jgi:hypothetical protein
MKLSLEAAGKITDARNQAMIECDVEAFLGLWADDLIVEGPTHYLEGKGALRAAMEGAWAAMKPVAMITLSLAVNEDAMFYEFAIVQEVRANGDRFLFSGMTYHQVDDSSRLKLCREYFDPPGHPRRTVAGEPRLAGLLPRSAS